MELQNIISLFIAAVFIYAFISGKASKRNNCKSDFYNLHRFNKRIVRSYKRDPGGVNDSGIGENEEWLDDSEGRYGSQLN